MAKTYQKSKIEDFRGLVHILLDQSNEKYNNSRDLTDKKYLSGQKDAYHLVLKILERDFELTQKEQ
ncbi:hypothetical protein [Bacillus sp. MRMR6]|uniref:hypothetical protein n=1 Tax=Bacillus sp. MRMR6 TaxID=1928617 RepID=UPI00095218B0|nr:hypothetical protein [Bacillus sp. MRMR6]OLS40815.1 hypothetical protein BTR25_07975 [Bacillus sp. MRMR6]